VPELIGPACTIVTELVNNVVVHARTPMELVLRLRERHLNISVRDGSAARPEARGPSSPTAPGGRGLMMVAAVAQRWGYTPVAGGKVVWAVLRTDAAPAG
jgi:anti-sigma regulatory factor (Ser/Thr protein kinase)